MSIGYTHIYTTTMKIINLPWPPKELSPNSTLHWAKKAKYKKMYRETCWVLALESKVKVDTLGKIPITITFYPPDKRHRDADNMVASIKAGLDGIADALKVNDRQFLPTFIFSEEVKGLVKIDL
jgi:crossover junction endodeoxyribonuclease RusA